MFTKKQMITRLKSYIAPYYNTAKHELVGDKHFKGGDVNLPSHLTLAFTFKCKAACPHCFFIQENFEFKKENVTEQLIHSIFQSKNGSAIKSVTCGGGEALLHENFFHLVKVINSYKVKSLQVVTNGISLEDERIVTGLIEQTELTNIHVSLDAIDESNYAAKKGVKRCNFDLICQNTKRIATSLKNGKTRVGISYVISLDEINDLRNMIDFACDLNVDYCHITMLHVLRSGNKLSDDAITKQEEMYSEILSHQHFGVDVILQPAIHEKNMQYYCESLDDHLSVSPTGVLSVCCHMPWNEAVGVYEDTNENCINNERSLEMRQKFIQAHKTNDSGLLPEECRFCNRRLRKLYYFYKDRNKWFYV